LPPLSSKCDLSCVVFLSFFLSFGHLPCPKNLLSPPLLQLPSFLQSVKGKKSPRVHYCPNATYKNA
jgi:hypothetical protein